ncbi:alpha/beta hydrolase family protein [Tenacibaculum jejuense]|uniref:Alpha/beta hydrolase n=1 Tax=Tenacibaculum jejuense TaxID=584609 RepID=A0A238U443_9FLAO|nr:alpha/beta hydrolase [Tenacibaculum jejuense]SNR13973.1 Alpha/beta hydrolase [Tenacibaculum jejuense]
MKKIKNIKISSTFEKPILLDVFYKSNHQKKDVIIFCHGYKGFKDWGAWDLMGEAFAEAGLFFMKFNFSHNGTTTENPLEFGDLEAFGNNNYSKELDDLNKVIDWCSQEEKFKNEINENAIALLGHSRAGGIVCIKAEEDPRVKKVISLAGVSDYKRRTATTGELESWKNDGVKYILNGRTGQQMPHFYQFYEDFIANEDRLTIKRAVKNLKIPFCIIHGNADTSIAISEAEDLLSWNPSAAFHIIENANHVFGAKHPWLEAKAPSDLQKVVAICKSFLGN